MCIDLDVVPQTADPDAVFQCAMTCLSTAGELAIVLAAGADCPIAAVFFYQVFDMGYRAHDSRLIRKLESSLFVYVALNLNKNNR
jgi:hypothetical protein